MKILIVDDEIAIHEQLKMCIPTVDLGWTIVGDALDGEEACRLVKKYQPDIIITDIKMPLLDGLSFMEWLKENHFAGKVIVLSGYGDFTYSRPAFLLDAFDYLLKPLQEAELLRTLIKAVEELTRDSNRIVEQINEKAVLNQGIVLMRDELMTQIVSGKLKDEIDIFVRAEQLFIAMPESKYMVMAIHLVDLDEHIQDRYRGDRSIFYYAARNILEEMILEYGGIVFRNLQKSGEYVIVIEEKGPLFDPIKRARSIHLSLTACLRVKALIGISSVKQSLSALAAAYFEGVHAIETVRFGEQETIVRFGEERTHLGNSGDQKEWKDLQILLEFFVKMGSIESETSLMTKFEEAMHHQSIVNMSRQDFKQAVNILIDTLEQVAYQSENILYWLQEARSSVQEWNVKQVQILLRNIMDQLLKSLTKNQKTKTGKQLIYSVKQYVEENFQDISLEGVSQRFYLNKNYFCSIFKSVTGENFSEYLTRVRMEQAKLLLANSSLTTYEIAEKVGYQDQRYFSKIFRKTTGMLPKQFRVQNQSDI